MDRLRELLAEIRIVRSLVAVNIRFRLAHRADLLAAVGASFVGTLASFAFLPLLFARAPRLGEWSAPEIVFLYGFALVPVSIFNAVSWNLYEFPEKVVFEGRFDRLLLRPQATLVQVLFDSMRIEALQETATGILLVAWASPRIGIHWSAGRVAAFVLFSFSGGLLYIAVFSALTAISFRFEDRVGLVPPVYNLIGFSRYPMTIYSAWIRLALSTLVPFAFASFYPASLLLGRMEWAGLAIASPLVAVVSLFFASRLWEREVRRYSGTGS
jgi:ABC-2 type transport system permease protein